MNVYRLEWPSAGDGIADRWRVARGAAAARRQALRLLRRRRRAVPWVRIVLTGLAGDVEDAFVTESGAAGWTVDMALPATADAAAPVAAPEAERLRLRALAGFDVVLEWSRRKGVLTARGAEAARLSFDAAMLGVIAPDGGRGP